MLENNDSVNYYSRWDCSHLCVLYDAQTREIAWCLKKKLNELLLMWGASPLFFLHFLWAWTPDVWDSMMLEKKWMSYYWCEGRPPFFSCIFCGPGHQYLYIYLWTIIVARGVPPFLYLGCSMGVPHGFIVVWFFCEREQVFPPVSLLHVFSGRPPGITESRRTASSLSFLILNRT